MHLEIERKFLVKGDFRQDVANSFRIKQGYIAVNQGIAVRARIMHMQGFITIKSGYDKAGLSCSEWEKEITISEAERLLKICETRVIDKTRYIVPLNGRVWEVDEFHGENLGLVIADIELESESDSFDKPYWLGREVTGEKRYYNSALSINPYSTWRSV